MYEIFVHLLIYFIFIIIRAICYTSNKKFIFLHIKSCVRLKKVVKFGLLKGGLKVGISEKYFLLAEEFRKNNKYKESVENYLNSILINRENSDSEKQKK